MRFRAIAWMLGLLLLAVPASAADVDGKWTGSVDTPNGAFPVTFVFKAEGSTLTGSTGPTGVVSPTEIKLRSEIMGMPFEYVVKKAS
jgi:hypothetical protein